MLTLTQVSSFLLTAVVLTATPGPDNLMVLSVGMTRGRLPGIAFGLGCAFGCISHTLLAALGVSALVAASPTAFTLLKFIGGAYLVRLGVLAIRHAGAVRLGSNGAQGESLQRLFVKGLTANAVNPKVVLFFLSFLPQFVVAAQGQVALQLAVLGLVFTAQAAVLFGLLGFFSGSIGDWLNRRPAAGKWLDRLAGAVFIGLGIRIVLSH